MSKIISQKLNEQLKDIRESQQFISNQYEEIKQAVAEVAALKSKLSDLENTVKMQDKEIVNLQLKIAQQDQYSRRNNLEIREVAVTAGEQVEEIVIRVAGKAGVQVTSTDIEAAHRVKSEPGKIPMIIARFVNRKVRNEVLKQRKTTITNHEIAGTGPGRIYISENMCPFYRKLHFEVRTKAKDKGYQFVWFVENKILVRKAPGTPTIAVESAADLHKII